MSEVLNKFCSTSGMTINFDKSKVLFSKTGCTSTINHFQNTLNIRQTSDLGYYLGYPLKPTYKNANFTYIKDKLNMKLQGWKTNLLSKIGRTQLINSTTSNLSSHVMKAFLLPKCILNKIDTKMREFFFLGHTINARKVHIIKWDKITKPKSMGGLRIRRVEHQNKVHLMNLFWRLNHSPNKNLAEMLTNKYRSNLPKRKVNQSFTYRGIQQTLSLYISCIKTIIEYEKLQTSGMITGCINPLGIKFIAHFL